MSWNAGASGLTVALPPYDAELSITLTRGLDLVGQWVKRRGEGKASRLALRATRGEGRFAPPNGTPPSGVAATPACFAGTWRVLFESDDNTATCALVQDGAHRVLGTFRTALGDYRFLEGDRHGNGLRLSCFDGAHAFLFTATMGPDGTLNGDFWSSDSWHETWRAARDRSVRLDDPFSLTTWNDDVVLGDLSFPDLEGTQRTLDDPAFAGKARVIQLFGSWCPNCNDASRYLGELHRRYSDRGLSIVGLAFEFSDDHATNAQRVRLYKATNRSDYPVLIAGPADKAKASAAFPALDRVRAYPTTIFMDAKGDVRAVHTGFDGPATGTAHERLKGRFEALIEELIGER